jgi:hypothetical protein
MERIKPFAQALLRSVLCNRQFIVNSGIADVKQDRMAFVWPPKLDPIATHLFTSSQR